jgi:hypothetical protein
VTGSGLTSWLGGDTYLLHVDAGDRAGATPGSGVASVEVLVDGTRADYAQQPCDAGDCPMTRDFTLSSAAYAEGRHTVTVVVTDQVGRRVTRNLLVQLDRSDPQVTLSGDLWDAQGTTISRGNYDVSVDASDGSGFANPRSGVQSIEILMNGVRVDLASQTCAQFDSCPLSSSYRFKVNQHPNGTYAFDVVVTDFAGHAVTRSWQVVKFR